MSSTRRPHPPRSKRLLTAVSTSLTRHGRALCEGLQTWSVLEQFGRWSLAGRGVLRTNGAAWRKGLARHEFTLDADPALLPPTIFQHSG